MKTPQLLAALQKPTAYGFDAGSVGVVQTHASMLFFAGGRVYKVKKPVDFGFLDFTELEQRRHFCEEEVRLNQPLAGSVYRGVVPIVRTPSGEVRVGGEGPAIEWAVEMNELPAGDMLETRLEEGRIDNSQLDELAALLVRFHQRAATGPGIDDFATLECVSENVMQNFEQLVLLADRDTLLSQMQLAYLKQRAETFFHDNAPLFERRIQEARAREGHGDLHASNICLTDEGIRIYDRIEFSMRFRCGDVAADLAFLAMDLDMRGLPAFSRYLVRRYANLARDPELVALMSFYKSYRAVVRGKVAALTASGESVSPELRSEEQRKAMRYVHLAVGYELPPSMILMCGLPASGKSWLARALKRPLRAVLHRSDVRRRMLPASAQEAPYSEESVKLTYDSLLRRASYALRRGRTAIVDASFQSQTERARFFDVAARLGCPFYVVHATAPESEITRRMRARAEDPDEPSDAGLDVYHWMQERFEPPVELSEQHVIEVDSTSGLDEQHTSAVLDRMCAQSCTSSQIKVQA